MPLRLTDAELPALFKVADSASLNGQQLYIRATKTRLILAILAAALAAVTLKIGGTWDLPALTVTGAFIVTLITEIWLLSRKPERDWYDGRALAESVKTLCWRYSVAAAPFPAHVPDPEAELHFVAEVEKLIHESPSDLVVIATPVSVTDRMREIRNSNLSERRSIYLEGRIKNQLNWYSGKATFNSARARRWRFFLIVIEGAGIVAAMLKAGSVIDFDLPGIVAALLGAGSAWFAVRQYESLGRAYTFAANDLSMVHARLQRITEQSDWEREVADAEEAISREHTMWRASRGAVGA
ncbi:DUF4231 domain-containing protein [Streptomyces sp. NPDC056165]|uniref:DUF4231 domain-containing protein n=1 Tax=Streptomyces sp. NPDC056165 TaxID=3345733 RepID=UPI0035D71061